MEPAVPKTNFTIATEAYQGPFELLLDLIEERKLFVNDLALSTITEDFVAHVRAQAAFPIEETANFIQIAATLLLIKSKSLIPDLELTDDENSDIEDLKRRLAAYEKVREAARELSRIFGGAAMAGAGERSREATFAPSDDLSSGALAAALARLIAAREEVRSLPTARVKPLITIEEMMDRLAKRVQSALTLSFKEFSKNSKERIEVIISFLALLELVKRGAVAAEQHEMHGDIRIKHAAPASIPRYG